MNESCKNPPCVHCGAPSHTDVRLVPNDTDLPRLAFCQDHEQVVVEFLRSLVRPEHIPAPKPGPTYFYRLVYRKADGTEVPVDVADTALTIKPADDAPVIDWSWPRDD